MGEDDGEILFQFPHVDAWLDAVGSEDEVSIFVFVEEIAIYQSNPSIMPYPPILLLVFSLLLSLFLDTTTLC